MKISYLWYSFLKIRIDADPDHITQPLVHQTHPTAIPPRTPPPPAVQVMVTAGPTLPMGPTSRAHPSPAQPQTGTGALPCPEEQQPSAPTTPPRETTPCLPLPGLGFPSPGSLCQLFLGERCSDPGFADLVALFGCQRAQGATKTSG